MNKFDPTKPVKTRGGRKARIICTDRQYTSKAGEPWPIVALVTYYGNEEHYFYFRANGTAPLEQDDLVNIPEETKLYRILFTDGVVSVKQYATLGMAASDVPYYPSHMRELFMGYQETVFIDGEVTAFNIIKKEA